MTEPETSNPDTDAQIATDPAPRKRRRGMRAVLYCCLGLLVILAALAGAVAYSYGRTFQAPDWARDLAVEQFSSALPDGDVTFDAVTFEIQNDWHPRILLERVVISPTDGGPTIEFSEAETSLSYRRLLKRQAAPLHIRLSGVFLAARRDANGQVAVVLGTQGQNSGENTALPEVMQQIDEWLMLPQFERLTSVSIDAVTIQFDDLRANRAWTVDGGQFLMERMGQELQISSNFALLGGRDFATSLQMNYESQIGEATAQFGATIVDAASEDIASQSPALAWLDLLRAPISGAMRMEVNSEGELGPLSASLQIAEGVIQPRDAIRAIPFQSARAYLTYMPDTNTIQFDELSVQSSWVNARAEGRAHLEAFDGGLPNALIAQIKLTELSGNPADLFNAPIALEHAQADLRLQLDPFELRIGEALLRDQGQLVLADGVLTAAKDEWSVALNAHVDAVAADRVLDWWPENAAAKARDWVDKNVLAGQLSDVNFAMRSKPGQSPDVYVDFQFDDASVRYAKKMPVATDGRGHAVLVNDRFAVTVKSGQVAPGVGGVLEGAGTTFVIPDIRAKPTLGEVNLKTSGTVTATLAMIDSPPLEFLSKAKLPVDLAQGKAKVSGTLHLPLIKGLKTDQVVYDLKAEATEVRTEHFVKDKVIAVPLLRATATPEEGLVLLGRGRIGAVPFDGAVRTALSGDTNGLVTLDGTLELSERFIDEFNIGLTRDLVSGSGRGDFEMRFEKGAPGRFAVTSDTKGLRMGVAALGWSKPPNQTANLTVEGLLSTPLAVTGLILDAPGLAAQGTVSLNQEGGLDRVSLSAFSVGNWLEGSADLIGRGSRAPDIVLRSGALDLRNAPETRAGGASGSGINIDAALNRVTISDGISLSGFQGQFTTTGGFNGSFSSRVNGGATIQGAIVPRNGRSAVRIQSADAGGTLRSAGIFKQAFGGNLDVTLIPVGEAGYYDGRLEATTMRLRDAPAMAELLNAISVVGLLEQLGGDGIAFSNVDAEFKLSPRRVLLTQGSAVGPSMGISMDGAYTLGSEELDMQGVVSPVYILNAIGRPISKKGEGLIGFNYSLTGTADNPRVRVNPLSVLTPGFLRGIFRRPSPKLDEGEASQ